MNDHTIFTSNLFLHNELEDISAIFYDSEGKFPSDELKNYIANYKFDLREFSYHLVKYAVYCGTNIALEDEFFDYLKELFGTTPPEILFWRAYDALIRGNPVFDELWLSYMAIELKKYTKPFIIEALVIPEDPLFLNVESKVHDHQQRLIQQFVLQDVTKSKISDSEYDTKLQEYLGDYSLLLSVFRLLQVSFDRDLIFNDLDNLLVLLTSENIFSLGPYWEMRFLSQISYWKTSLGLVFDVVDNLANLKNLNASATNFLIESQIFHIEALIAYKNNQIDDSIQLLQSAYYLAQEYDFFYQAIEVLFSKFTIDSENLTQTTDSILSITTEKEHPLLRARLYAMLGAYYIQQQNWDEAETKLLQSSKLVQGSYDKKTYYQVIADFSYVLVITNQLKEALESSVALIDDTVPLLYRIRGFYLYGLTLTLLDQQKDAIEIIEEGIRIALSFKEHISLPWFYELLEFIYLAINDRETALRYSNLTFKAYFDASKSEEGYRSKIRSSYILALNKDYGRALSQVMGLFSEHLLPELQYESYSVLQLSFLASLESANLTKIKEIWQNIEQLDYTGELEVLVKLKNTLLNITDSTSSFDGLTSELSSETFNDKLYRIEYLLLAILYADRPFTQKIDWTKAFSFIKDFFNNLKITFSVFSLTETLIETKLLDNLNKGESELLLSLEDKEVLFAAIFMVGILRNLVKNLPFNFLIDVT